MIGVYIYIYIYIYIGTGSDRLYEHLRAKEGGKEKTGFSSSHGPLCFITSHSCVNRVFRLLLCRKRSACMRKRLYLNDSGNLNLFNDY